MKQGNLGLFQSQGNLKLSDQQSGTINYQEFDDYFQKQIQRIQEGSQSKPNLPTNESNTQEEQRSNNSFVDSPSKRKFEKQHQKQRQSQKYNVPPTSQHLSKKEEELQIKYCLLEYEAKIKQLEQELEKKDYTIRQLKQESKIQIDQLVVARQNTEQEYKEKLEILLELNEHLKHQLKLKDSDFYNVSLSTFSNGKQNQEANKQNPSSRMRSPLRGNPPSDSKRSRSPYKKQSDMQFDFRVGDLERDLHLKDQELQTARNKILQLEEIKSQLKSLLSEQFSKQIDIDQSVTVVKNKQQKPNDKIIKNKTSKYSPIQQNKGSIAQIDKDQLSNFFKTYQVDESRPIGEKLQRIQQILKEDKTRVIQLTDQLNLLSSKLEQQEILLKEQDQVIAYQQKVIFETQEKEKQILKEKPKDVEKKHKSISSIKKTSPDIQHTPKRSQQTPIRGRYKQSGSSSSDSRENAKHTIQDQAQINNIQTLSNQLQKAIQFTSLLIENRFILKNQSKIYKFIDDYERTAVQKIDKQSKMHVLQVQLDKIFDYFRQIKIIKEEYYNSLESDHISFQEEISKIEEKNLRLRQEVEGYERLCEKYIVEQEQLRQEIAQIKQQKQQQSPPSLKVEQTPKVDVQKVDVEKLKRDHLAQSRNIQSALNQKEREVKTVTEQCKQLKDQLTTNQKMLKKANDEISSLKKEITELGKQKINQEKIQRQKQEEPLLVIQPTQDLPIVQANVLKQQNDINELERRVQKCKSKSQKYKEDNIQLKKAISELQNDNGNNNEQQLIIVTTEQLKNQAQQLKFQLQQAIKTVPSSDQGNEITKIKLQNQELILSENKLQEQVKVKQDQLEQSQLLYQQQKTQQDAKMNDFVKQSQQLTQQIDILNTKLQALEKPNTQKDLELDRMQKILQAEKVDQKDSIQLLNNQELESLKIIHQQQQIKLQELEQSIHEKDSSISQQQNLIDAKAKEYQDLVQSKEILQSQYIELEKNMLILKNLNLSYEKENKDHHQSVDTNKPQLIEELDTLRNNLKQTQDRVDEQSKSIIEFTAKVHDLHAQLDIKGNEIKELNASNETQKGLVSDMEKDLTKMKILNQSLEDEIKVQSQDKLTFEQQNVLVEKKIEQLEKESSIQQVLVGDKIYTLEKQYKTLSGENKLLNEELDKLKLENTNLAEQLNKGLKDQVNVKDDPQSNELIEKLKQENSDLKGEILDQNKLLSEQIQNLTSERKNTIKLKKRVEELNSVGDLQEQFSEAQQQLEQVTIQNQQINELCVEQMSEIESLKQQNNELNGKLNFLQKQLEESNKNNPHTNEPILPIFTKEEVGSQKESSDSSDSEVEKLEEQIAEKDQQLLEKDAMIQERDMLLQGRDEIIQQIYAELQSKVNIEQKAQLLEEKLKAQKNKQQDVEVVAQSKFWDLLILCNYGMLTSLGNSNWKFVSQNHDFSEFTQQVSFFSLDQQIMKKALTLLFSQEEINDEIANSFEKNDHCYLKTLQYGAYLQGEKLLKKNLKQSFLIYSKILNLPEMHSYQIVEKGFQKKVALEEFWLQYCITYNSGSVCLVFDTIGTQEIQLIRRVCWFQDQTEHPPSRIIIILLKQLNDIKEKEQDVIKQTQQNFDFVQCDLDEVENFKEKKLWINVYQDTDRQQFDSWFKSLVKNDISKNQNPVSFVDMLRDYICNVGTQYFVVEQNEAIDFRSESDENGNAFTLQIVYGDQQKLRLKQDRPTLQLGSDDLFTSFQFKQNQVQIQVMGNQQYIRVSKKKYCQQSIQGQGTMLNLKVKVKTEMYSQERRLLFNIPTFIATEQALIDETEDNQVTITLKQ